MGRWLAHALLFCVEYANGRFSVTKSKAKRGKPYRVARRKTQAQTSRCIWGSDRRVTACRRRDTRWVRVRPRSHHPVQVGACAQICRSRSSRAAYRRRRLWRPSSRCSTRTPTRSSAARGSVCRRWCRWRGPRRQSKATARAQSRSDTGRGSTAIPDLCHSLILCLARRITRDRAAYLPCMTRCSTCTPQQG